MNASTKSYDFGTYKLHNAENEIPLSWDVIMSTLTRQRALQT